MQTTTATTGHTIFPLGPSIDEQCREWIEKLQFDLGLFHDVYNSGEVEEIETKPYDGFIPYTDGGYELVAYADFRSAQGSGRIPEGIKDMLEGTLEDCRREFEREHGVDPWEVIEDDELMEAWWDHEDTWLSEGTTYFYKVRCQYYTADNPRNDSGEDEVYFTAYLNTDLEYGRDYVPWLSYMGGKPDQTYGGFNEIVPVSELTPERFEELYEKALDALNDC